MSTAEPVLGPLDEDPPMSFGVSPDFPPRHVFFAPPPNASASRYTHGCPARMLRSSGFANFICATVGCAVVATAASCHVPRMPMPVEIVGLLRSTITFVWEDEHKTVYPARQLRLACRCAQCIEETTGK